MSSDSDSDIENAQSGTVESHCENKSREQILDEKIDNLTNIIVSLQQQINRNNSENGTKKRKRNVKIEVPQRCAGATRDIYTTLTEIPDFRGFNFQQSVHSTHNAAVIEAILKEVRVQFGEEKWNQAEITAAAKRYYKSLRDQSKRVTKGTADRHKLMAKLRNSRISKQSRRLKALEDIDWSISRKERVKGVLENLEYISLDEEANPETRTRKSKKLSWESKRLAKYKVSLDSHYNTSVASGKQKLMLFQQIKDNTCTVSNRKEPENAPSWSVKKGDEENSLDDSNIDS